MEKSSYAFVLDMKVRDYECDLQGIVNNGVYMNYLEHCRHEYMNTLGINFSAYAKQGINFVVVRAELDYKFSLTSGDRFYIAITMFREKKIKIVFQQDIYRSSDDKPIMKARIIATALNEKGRPRIPDEVIAILDTLPTPQSA